MKEIMHRPMKKRPFEDLILATVGAGGGSVAMPNHGKNNDIAGSEGPNNNNNNNLPLSAASTKTILFHQQQKIETIENELEHERTLRGLDKKRMQQLIDRLEQKLALTLQEVTEQKELMELQSIESNRIIQQLKDGKQKALQHVRELELEMNDLNYNFDHKHSHNSEMEQRWKSKCQQYQQQIQVQMKNEEDLKEQIKVIKSEFIQFKELHANENLESTKFESKALSSSDATPPGNDSFQIELRNVRIELADSQRSNRIYQRKYDDLAQSYQQSMRENERMKQQTKRCAALEEEIQTLRSTNEQMSLLNRSWLDMQNKLRKVWNPERQQLLKGSKSEATSTTATKDTKITSSSRMDELSMPPDVSIIVQSIEKIEQDSKAARSQCQQYQEECHSMQMKLEELNQEISILKTTKLDLQVEQRRLKSLVDEVESKYDRVQHQAALYQRESDSLRSLISTYESSSTGEQSSKNVSLHSGNFVSTQKYEVLQVTYNTLKEKINAIQDENNKLLREYNEVKNEKMTVENEIDTIKNKFGLLKEAYQNEKGKVQDAENRANIAEKLAGQGSFNPETTKILHLSETPFISALKEEIDILKRQVEHYSSTSSRHQPGSAGSADSTNKSSYSTPGYKPSDPNSKTKSASSSVSSSLPVNFDKLNQRLKENFKEQIALFREGVYLLTGYKIDMIATPASASTNTISGTTTDRPMFRIRSRYAENEDDHLLFQWPKSTTNISSKKKMKNRDNENENKYDGSDDDDDEEKSAVAVSSLDLLNTPLAKLLTTTTSYQYMTNYQSIPAFLASVQLSLFDQQTHIMMGSSAI